MRLKKFYILLMTLLLTTIHQGIAQDGISLITKVSKRKVGVNQRLRIEFIVNKQGADNFEPPDFQNFDIIAGPSSSISQSWVNGKSSYSQGYIYIIKPKRLGVFTLPKATIEYNGKTVYSNEVVVTVVSEAEMPKDPNDPSHIASENVHVVTEISNRNPYVGEPIYVVYKLYFSHNVGLSGDWRVKEIPQYNGFWNHVIDVDNNELKNVTYKGESYRSLTLKKALLIPQKSGKLVIDPMNMDITVNVPTGRGDFFGNAITRNISHTTTSSSKTVTVKPLPTEGKPIGFTGAVGDFDFLISASKDILRANETTQIKVEVSGKGNLKLFELPKIETPAELEVYTPERSDKVQITTRGVSGKITDSYTVVPEYKGKYKIPKVSFSYFSLKDKVYKTITTDPLYIDVAEGKALPNGAVINQQESTQTTAQKVVVSEDNNFKYIRTKTVFKPVNREDFFQSKLFYFLLFLPFIAIPIGLYIGFTKEKRDQDVVGKRQRKADKLARKFLSQAKKQLGNKEAFYIALEKALHNYLKAKLTIETTDISKERITEILQERKVELLIIKDFIDVLNDCDFARYTPSNHTMMQRDFDKAKGVITKMDKQL